MNCLTSLAFCVLLFAVSGVNGDEADAFAPPPASESCSPEECPGKNEKFTTCGGCERTCENYDKHISCTAVCRTGCFCEKGYVRNDLGQCVWPTECSEECKEECPGENEEYTTCGGCEHNCENYDKQITCPAICRTGCFCKDGYVRNEYNECVSPSECPGREKCCPKNERFYPCGRCEKTCDNFDQKVFCTLACRPGCYCKKGLVRNHMGHCIRPSHCPPKGICCENGEEYLKCGSACPPKCPAYEPAIASCPAVCVKGCFCRKHLLRREDGKCVMRHECHSHDEIIYK